VLGVLCFARAWCVVLSASHVLGAGCLVRCAWCGVRICFQRSTKHKARSTFALTKHEVRSTKHILFNEALSTSPRTCEGDYVRVLMTLAGTPTATDFSGIDFVTTLPAAITD